MRTKLKVKKLAFRSLVPVTGDISTSWRGAHRTYSAVRTGRECVHMKISQSLKRVPTGARGIDEKWSVPGGSWGSIGREPESTIRERAVKQRRLLRIARLNGSADVNQQADTFRYLLNALDGPPVLHRGPSHGPSKPSQIYRSYMPASAARQLHPRRPIRSSIDYITCINTKACRSSQP